MLQVITKVRPEHTTAAHCFSLIRLNAVKSTADDDVTRNGVGVRQAHLEVRLHTAACNGG